MEFFVRLRKPVNVVDHIFGDTLLECRFQTFMTSKHIPQTLFIVALLGFGVWIVYGILFPSRHHKPGEQASKIQIIAKETPYFSFTGLDEPHYYVIPSQKYSNDFHISDEVLDLVQDNDSISNAIKKIKYGDTLFIYMDSTSMYNLNKSHKNIEIVGLGTNIKMIINPDKMEKYYRKYKSNNRFSLFAIAIILFFIYRKGIKSKKVVQ